MISLACPRGSVGTRANFYYREKPDYGIADLYVDGSKVASVDQYSATETAGQSIHVTLADGDHVLEVRHVGRKNVDSSGYDINLDKVVVSSLATPTPTPTSTPTATPTYMQVTVGLIVSTDTDYNLFEGWEIVGYPETVLLRGKIVVHKDKWMGEAGMGQFVPRIPNAEIL